MYTKLTDLEEKDIYFTDLTPFNIVVSPKSFQFLNFRLENQINNKKQMILKKLLIYLYTGELVGKYVDYLFNSLPNCLKLLGNFKFDEAKEEMELLETEDLIIKFNDFVFDIKSNCTYIFEKKVLKYFENRSSIKKDKIYTKDEEEIIKKNCKNIEEYKLLHISTYGDKEIIMNVVKKALLLNHSDNLPWDEIYLEYKNKGGNGDLNQLKKNYFSYRNSNKNKLK